MSSVDIIDARKRRWRDLYRDEGRRKLVFKVLPDKDTPPRPLPLPHLKQERIEWAWGRYERAMERMAWLADDALPFLNPYTGTEIFAAALGCRVATPDNDMPFALPIVRTAAEASKLPAGDPDAAPLRLVFEIADELRRRSGSGALMALPDIQSPMDITALIWDKTDLFCAMVTEPQAVKELAAKTLQLLTGFLDEWFARYGPELIGHYPQYYFPRGVTVSEDEIGSVSEAMFDEFFLPSLRLLADRYGGIGIHCCAGARHQWAGLKRIDGLRLMNICQPAEIAREAHAFFSPEIAHHHYGWTPDGPPRTWPPQFPEGARVVIELHEDDRHKAAELAEKLNAARNVLLVPQGLDGVEFGGAEGGVDAADQADGDGHGQREDQRQR